MKYPLAIVDHLLKTYGPDFGLGYDIMCAFFKTMQKSTLAPRVAALRLRGVVPAFHGHAHNRGCQVSWHPMYAVGVGIEDFEECERTFCKSNELAGVTRMATSFHRRQQLVEHFDFHDMDKHLASGNFIYQNYRQAIEPSDQPALELLRERTGTTAVDQENDLKNERAYLQGLRHEPAEEVMAADYIELLETLYKLDSSKASAIAKREALGADPSSLGYTARQVTGIRTWATTSIAKYVAHHEVVVDFELQHSIETRWLPDCPEYQQAVKVVEQRRYRRALDNLERLVVQRFFELTKLNQSGVGKQNSFLLCFVGLRELIFLQAISNDESLARRSEHERRPYGMLSTRITPPPSSCGLPVDSSRGTTSSIWLRWANSTCSETRAKTYLGYRGLVLIDAKQHAFTSAFSEHAKNLCAFMSRFAA
ncbi:hypothetical protein EV714DRAFT_222321 [Schizophyllum commune]